VAIDEVGSSALAHPKRADFSRLVGKWLPGRGFDEIIETQRRIDEERWK
jgi:hypothetical protein